MIVEIRKLFLRMARAFKGDSSPYARGYRAALRDAKKAIEREILWHSHS